MDGPPEVLGAPPPHAFHMVGCFCPHHKLISTLLFFQIQDENHQLRSKIAELEKRVSDLTATNEFLLDQNAHLRMGGKSAGNFSSVFVLFLILYSSGPPVSLGHSQQGFMMQ